MSTAMLTKAIPELGQAPYKPAESTGTTLIGLEIQDGVIIGADSRTSAGNYIVSRATDKLTPVTDHIYVCRSGSSADTQAITDIIRYQLGAFQMIYGEKPTVEIAAAKFKKMSYEYRDDLMASFLVAGWDEEKGGQIYAVPIGGMITRRKMASAGSGSSFINGYLDKDFKEGMTKEEGIDFILKGITLATLRDGSSGGVVRIAVITKDGTEKMYSPSHLQGGNDEGGGNRLHPQGHHPRHSPRRILRRRCSHRRHHQGWHRENVLPLSPSRRE